MWIAEELVRKDWTKTSRGRAADVSALFIFEQSRARARSVVTQSLPMLTRKGFKAEVGRLKKKINRDRQDGQDK
jgi:hypothetical protein